MTALLILDDVRVGDVIDYAYTIKGRNPVFSGKYFSSFPLGWKVPVDQVSVRVMMPEGRQLFSRVYNADVSASDYIVAGYHVYQWSIEDTLPIRDEDGIPGWYNAFPWIQVSEYHDWGEVGRWAEELYSNDTILTPELQAQISTWQGNRTNSEKAMLDALAFVQDDVRYFGGEMGTNSHMPSQPGVTFERRYGDCKDKAMLLVAILRAMGYSAKPALVSIMNERAIADWLPSPGVFDHVIVKTEINDHIYWIDSTREFQRGPLALRGQPDFGRALVVGEVSSSLASINLEANYLPSVAIEEKFTAHDYSGRVNFVVTSQFSFTEAEARRRYFAMHSLADIQEFYLNYYSRYYPGLEVAGEIEINDDEDVNVFTVTERYLVPEYWTFRDGRLYTNFHGSGISEYTRLPNTINRKMPLSINYPLHVHHSSILEFPGEIGFDQLAINENIIDPSMRFEVVSSYKDRALRVDYFYNALSDAVMPENIVEHLANRRKINDNLFYSAWVGNADSLSRQAFFQPDYINPELRSGQTTINSSHY